MYLCLIGLMIAHTHTHNRKSARQHCYGLRVWYSLYWPPSLIRYHYCNLWVEVSLAKTNAVLSLRCRGESSSTQTSTHRQRLERRLCLGFLLLEQRFMVGESCRESLRLNYTDGEHQIQEKLPRLWREWWGLDESGIERGRYRSRVREREMYYTKPISINSSTLGRPQTHHQARPYWSNAAIETIRMCPYHLRTLCEYLKA